jgi:hypothetical protein
LAQEGHGELSNFGKIKILILRAGRRVFVRLNVKNSAHPEVHEKGPKKVVL